MAGFTEKRESPLQVMRRVQKAASVLGLAPDAVTAADVKKHYALLVKSLHPDSPDRVAGLAADVTLDQIRQAKDYLIKYLEDENA